MPHRIRSRAVGLLVAAVGLSVGAGCASSTASRIQERPAAFAGLSVRQQALVREGRIERGFSTDAVYLALGKPSAVEPQSGGGTKWVYRNFYPSPAVTGEGLYRTPDAAAGAGDSRSLYDVVGKAGGVTDAGSGAGLGGSGAGARPREISGNAEVEPALMEVWFVGGRVTSFRLTP